jgi:hypothetical protein
MEQKQELSDCVLSLKEVRAQLHNEMDPSIAVRLDGVIQQFESCLKQEVADPLLVQVARSEGLKTIGLIIESVVTIADIIRHLCS